MPSFIMAGSLLQSIIQLLLNTLQIVGRTLYVPTYLFPAQRIYSKCIQDINIHGLFCYMYKVLCQKQRVFLSSTTFQYKVLLNNLVLMMPIIFLLQIHRSTNRKGKGVQKSDPLWDSVKFLKSMYRNAILNSTQGNLSSNCENFLYSIKDKSLPRCYVWAQVHTLSPLSKGYLISESFLSSKKMFQITILSTIWSTIRLRRIVICNLFWRMEPK